MRKLNDLGASRVMLGQCPSGTRMLHPEHTERESHFRALRPLKDRIPVGDSDFKRLFDKINLTHATLSIHSRLGRSISVAATLPVDEPFLIQVSIVAHAA